MSRQTPKNIALSFLSSIEESGGDGSNSQSWTVNDLIMMMSDTILSKTMKNLRI